MEPIAHGVIIEIHNLRGKLLNPENEVLGESVENHVIAKTQLKQSSLDSSYRGPRASYCSAEGDTKKFNCLQRTQIHEFANYFLDFLSLESEIHRY